MFSGILLFAIFALLASGGCFFIALYFRGSKFAALATLVVVTFFAVLGYSVWRVLASLGPTP